MTNAYCDLLEVKRSLAGDVPNIGSSHDQSLVDKILEVSRDVDRKVAECRGEPDELFSFLADQLYGQQIVYLSSTPRATDGTLVLAFAGEITGPILFDAVGADVQIALEQLDGVGSGNVSVSGFQGGPWTVDFAGTLSGPQPTLTGQATVTPTDATIVVLPTIQGVSVVPSERLFRTSPEVYGSVLPIDDCVEVVSVQTYGSNGAVSRVLSSNDYRPYPLRGLPIQGLKPSGSVITAWPDSPSLVGVVSRWGHRTSIPTDVREGTVIEVIRSHFAAQAGNDDRLGMTPYGSVITSKAFTSKFKELVTEYGYKLW